MKIDINDVFAVLGGGSLALGLAVKFDWMTALIVSGALLLALSIYRAK